MINRSNSARTSTICFINLITVLVVPQNSRVYGEDKLGEIYWIKITLYGDAPGFEQFY